MRKILVLVVISFVVGACSDGKKTADEGCCGSMDMPPSKALSPQEEAQALALYDEFNIVSGAAAQLPITAARHPRNQNEAAIHKMILENCELKETKTQNGQTENIVRAAQSLPGKNCPIEYLDKTSTTGRATSRTHAEAVGTASTKLRIISPELAALTPFNFWENAGGMKLDYVQKSQTTALISAGASQRGTLSIDDKTMGTLLKMRLKMEVTDGAFKNGRITVAMGAQSESGWLILKLEQKYVNGVKTHQCFLNGKDITNYPECLEQEQTLVMNSQPALRTWNELTNN